MSRTDERTDEPSGLSPEARVRFEEELAVLREQRAALGLDTDAGGPATGDRADNADVLLRLDEATHLDERINEIIRVLHGAPPRAEGRGDATQEDGGLTPGSTVVLRYEDGSEERLRAVAILEDVPEGDEDTAITLDSPLGQALAGHREGDTVSWDTPDGPLTAKLVSIQAP